MATELLTLANLINSQARIIDKAYSSAGKEFPLLSETSTVPVLDEPEIVDAAKIAIGAASRLIASLRNPYALMQETAVTMYTSALLNVVVETNIVEALKEAGPQGMHIKDLAPKIGMDPSKLARCLRYLCATRHIFQEVSPHVFANNRISITMDTGRPFDDISQARGPDRYANTIGCAAVTGTNTDEAMKGALEIPRYLLDPETAFSTDVCKTPVMRAFGFDGPFFQWLECPGNEYRLHRFGVAMQNNGPTYPADKAMEAFGWGSLPKGAIVVDVGGSVGATTLNLFRSFPDLHYIVQDRAPVIANAKKFWGQASPSAIESGQVELQAHDFFEPQTIQNVSVFMLRFILHMLSDPHATIVLKNLRACANSNTRLLVLDHVVPFTCPQKWESSIPGAEQEELPGALYGNTGLAEALVFSLDIQMMNFVGSQERTMDEWQNLLEGAGWKLVSVKREAICALVCVPK